MKALLDLLDANAAAWEAYESTSGFRNRTLDSNPRVRELNAADEEVVKTQEAWQVANRRLNDWLADFENLEMLRTALRRSGEHQ